MPSLRESTDRRRSVVYLESAPQAAFETREQSRARMDQRNEQFVPHVLAITAGTYVDFPNDDRTYHNVFFRAKAVFLLLAGLNAWLFHSGPTYRRLAEWDIAARTPRAAKLAGAFSLALWAAIVFSGRMIAYNWFDCESPQKSAFMDTIAGCDRSAEESTEARDASSLLPGH